MNGTDIFSCWYEIGVEPNSSCNKNKYSSFIASSLANFCCHQASRLNIPLVTNFTTPSEKLMDDTHQRFQVDQAAKKDDGKICRKKNAKVICIGFSSRRKKKRQFFLFPRTNLIFHNSKPGRLGNDKLIRNFFELHDGGICQENRKTKKKR